jgi:hypothetical protein
MGGPKSRASVLRTFAAAAIVVALAGAVSGCSGNQSATGAMGARAENASLESTGMTPDPNYQVCASCAKGMKAVPSTGTVEAVDGTQVVAIAIADGAYTPNRFVAKTGTPVTVVFTVEGKPAKGCLSTPTFKSLNTSVTVTSGEKSLDLGALHAGTYQFGCGMGMNVGQIVVQ